MESTPFTVSIQSLSRPSIDYGNSICYKNDNPAIWRRSTMVDLPRVWFLSPEAAPFAKTGGLADVVGSLPGALKALGLEVSIGLPLYRVRQAGGVSLDPGSSWARCAPGNRHAGLQCVGRGNGRGGPRLLFRERGSLRPTQSLRQFRRRLLRQPGTVLVLLQGGAALCQKGGPSDERAPLPRLADRAGPGLPQNDIPG